MSPSLHPFNLSCLCIFATRSRTSQHSLCFQSLPHSFSLPLRIFNNLHTLCIVKLPLNPAPSIASALFCKIYGVGIPPQGFGLSAEVGRYGDMLPGSHLWTSVPCSQCLRGNAWAGFRPANLRGKSVQQRAIPCQIRAIGCKMLPSRVVSPRRRDLRTLRRASQFPFSSFQFSVSSGPSVASRSAARILCATSVHRAYCSREPLQLTINIRLSCP